MQTGIEIKFQGVVHKTVVKPPVLDDEGFLKSQFLEVVLHIPLTDGVRTKMPDLSRLQNGQTTHVKLENAQYKFDATGEPPSKRPPKARDKKGKSKAKK